MTAPFHPIPAGSPSDAPAALSSSACAVGADIPAHPPAAGAPVVTAPPATGAEIQARGASLTPLELGVLDFIRDVIGATGLGPTLEEIADKFCWHSRSSAHRVAESLVRKGLLIKTAASKRGLALADTPLLSSVPTAALRAELARRQEAS